MPRARNIKPGFFRNEDLVELPFEARLLFIGLWTLADREGRLEDRPKRIKMEVFPADDVDVDSELEHIASYGMIVRYIVNGKKCIQITNFLRHQNPHHKEAASELPGPEEVFTEDSPRQTLDKPEASPGRALVKTDADPADSLIPDSLIPDNSVIDSVEPDDSPPSNGEITVIDPVVIGLPTNKHSTKGEEYCVLETHVAEFRALYPAVDVDQNLRNMRGWLVNNPTKRKTLKGMSTFVNSWLAREQDKARGSPNKPVSTRSKTLEEDLTDTSWAH